MPRRCLLGLSLLLVVVCGGCGLAALTAQLETRHVQSCIYTFGFLTPFHAVRIITATGGATVQQCHGLTLGERP